MGGRMEAIRAKIDAPGLDRLRLPRGLNLDAILGPSVARYRDQAAYIVHRVTCGVIADTRIRDGLRRGVPLRKEDMAKLFRKGGDYSKVMKALIGHGVIYTDGSYEVGRAAKHYQLDPATSGGKPTCT